MAVSSSYQFALDFALSPEGRIYIPFGDTRNQPWPQKDIYAQCLDLGGNYLWDPAGVLLARAPGDQWAPLLTLTENGFITCFNDTRSGYDDIYLQVVDSSGTALLGYAGAPLYINASDQDVYAVLPDGQGGAVAFWENWGVPEAVAYANHIMPDGRLGYPYKPQIVEPVTQGTLRLVFPGTVQYALPEAGRITLELYDILGRRVSLIEEGYRRAGSHVVHFPDQYLPSGIYMLHLTTPNAHQTAKIVIMR
jgi:hypothetical protein